MDALLSVAFLTAEYGGLAFLTDYRFGRFYGLQAVSALFVKGDVFQVFRVFLVQADLLDFIFFYDRFFELLQENMDN